MLDFSTPRETVVVCTRGKFNQMGVEKEKDNICAVDWHMPVSPEHFAISLSKSSLSYELINNSRVFVVNFVPYSFASKVVKIGYVSGKTHNKFNDFEIRKEEADGVECSYLREAVAYLSCHVSNEIEIGDYVIFVGKVVSFREFVKGAKRLFHLREDKFTKMED